MSVQFFFPDVNQIAPDSSETARYLGYKKSAFPQSDVASLIQSCESEMHPLLTPKAVYADFDLELLPQNNQISFADVSLASIDLSRNLRGCVRVVLFAATIGPKVDALIRRYQGFDTVRASVLQACGAMFIEELVGMMNNKIKEEAALSGLKCRPRYSPGYGDVELSVQKEFFRLLPTTKIGLTLMDSLIMAPEKSVTAFVGEF